MLLAARPAAAVAPGAAAAASARAAQRRCIAVSAIAAVAVPAAAPPASRPPLSPAAAAPSSSSTTTTTKRQQQHRRTQHPRAAAAAAAASAAAITATASLPAVAAACSQAAPYALAASAGVALVSAAALALLPRAWPLTQAVARARWPLVLLGLAYAALLAASWEPDTLSLMMPGALSEGLSSKGFAPQFFPTLEGVSRLFARPFTAASFLVHVAVANLVAARAVFWDASARRVPAAHSILLCAAFGPVGVLAHELTKLLGFKTRATAFRAPAPGGGGGSITLMPYSEE